MILLFCEGRNIVSLFFERGLFESKDTIKVTKAFFAYTWMLIPLILIGVIDQIYLIEKQLKYIIKRVLVGISLNIILNYFFIFIIRIDLLGIGLSTSICYWFMVILDY